MEKNTQKLEPAEINWHNWYFQDLSHELNQEIQHKLRNLYPSHTKAKTCLKAVFQTQFKTVSL